MVSVHIAGGSSSSPTPGLCEKLTTIVGPYVDPPAHAVVLSVDEKSQIQALDRTQPGLPMKKGRAGTRTHDYKRYGTTTLFAALNVLDGTVIAQNVQRHRHQEFDPGLQDRLGYHLLKRRGYDACMAGQITRTEFGRRLAMEWASFPVLADTRGAHQNTKRGQSYYAGDALNEGLVSPAASEKLLDDGRATSAGPAPSQPSPMPSPAPTPSRRQRPFLVAAHPPSLSPAPRLPPPLPSSCLANGELTCSDTEGGVPRGNAGTDDLRRLPASSQCNVRPCETRYSTVAACSHQCGQILETLKGNTAKLRKLQIWSL